MESDIRSRVREERLAWVSSAGGGVSPLNHLLQLVLQKVILSAGQEESGADPQLLSLTLTPSLPPLLSHLSSAC